jgi:hypothetical protein
MSDKTVVVCGQKITKTILQKIQQTIFNDPKLTRAELARQVCDLLNWYRPNGERKDMSCRVALLKLERQGMLQLPRATKTIRRTKKTDNCLSLIQIPVTQPVHQLRGLCLEPVTGTSRKRSTLWKTMIEHYHYLGYTPLVGAQFRYLIQSEQGYLGALGFSASAWKVAPRDQFIGWSQSAQKANLAYVICNSRFLILPWVQSKNLASKILSLCAKRLVSDWEKRYNYQPVLLETYVEKERFSGTCYRAANWIKVGQTQGRGKLDRQHQHALPLKDIWLYALRADFRDILCQENH